MPPHPLQPTCGRLFARCAALLVGLQGFQAPASAPEVRANGRLDLGVLLCRLAGTLEGPVADPELLPHRDHPAVLQARRLGPEAVLGCLEPPEAAPDSALRSFRAAAQAFAALPAVARALEAHALHRPQLVARYQTALDLDASWLERTLGQAAPHLVLIPSPLAPEVPLPLPGGPGLRVVVGRCADLDPLLVLALRPGLERWSRQHARRLQKSMRLLHEPVAALPGRGPDPQGTLVDTLAQAYLIRYHLDHGDTDRAREAGHRAATQGLPWAEPLAFHLAATAQGPLARSLDAQTPTVLSFLQTCAPRTGDRIALLQRSARKGPLPAPGSVPP